MKNNIYSCALEEVLVLSHVLNHLCLKWIQGYYYYQPLPIKHHDWLIIIFQEIESHEYLKYAINKGFSQFIKHYSEFLAGKNDS